MDPYFNNPPIAKWVGSVLIKMDKIWVHAIFELYKMGRSQVIYGSDMG